LREAAKRRLLPAKPALRIGSASTFLLDMANISKDAEQTVLVWGHDEWDDLLDAMSNETWDGENSEEDVECAFL
jgi:hypothetical protein